MQQWDFDQAAEFFYGRRVALIGSAPSCLDNKGSAIDDFDIVVRVQNYKLRGYQGHVGHRTDVVYSFWGVSMKKRPEELKSEGVQLCMCKCPNSDGLIDSKWHVARKKTFGINFSWIYERRKTFWPSPVYIPDGQRFLAHMNQVGGRMPTTGFAAILDLMDFDLSELYVTGFDFFRSKVHNVNEGWSQKDDGDPIAHHPERELSWLRKNKPEHMTTDRVLTMILESDWHPPTPREERLARLRAPASARRLRKIKPPIMGVTRGGKRGR